MAGGGIDHPNTIVRVLQVLEEHKGQWLVEERIRELCAGSNGMHCRAALFKLNKMGRAHYRNRQVPGHETRYRLWKVREKWTLLYK